MSADDHRLIAECLRGRTDAFGRLIHRYEERLFNTVYRLVDNAEDAQDVVQETFLNAYKSLGSFKGDAEFFTWLYRIAFNTAVNLKRKQRAAISLDGSHNGESGIQPLDPSACSQPGHALERAEQERRVQLALSRLSLEHRAVLVLKDMECLKYEQIAEILQVPIGTIRSRLHRARLEFRDVWEQSENKSV